MAENHSPETILQEALEISELQARAAYLNEVCGDDQALREEVESLLAAHFAANSDFMDTLADPLLMEAPTEKEGDSIGRYKLLQQIGEGGFGTVYLAEQIEPVKRRVALKVIKAGMDTKEVIARFEAERQALALMDHPNIAQVHDAGTTEGGRPYFVMELVKGVPLTKYCAEKDLDTKARLELFTDVCAAVQHAHQKGIIHRDLKPSNILVSLHDGKPVVKVIDFGIAKAIGMELTEKTVFTQLGRMIGTPQYMSPEQAELNALDVDTRSDIYSLGVVLYELLTGTTPLDGTKLRSAAYGEMQRMIREETPVKPSTRVSTSRTSQTGPTSPTPDPRALRGDLDWIVLKALEKERARRYETANALAQDLRRHLRDEPVTAGPPSASYRMKKFVRRNRRKLLSGALASAALLVGLAVAAGIWLDSSREKRDRVARAGELLVQAEDHWTQNASAEYEDNEHFLQARSLARRVEESLIGITVAGDDVHGRHAKLSAAIAIEERDRQLVEDIQEALMKSVSIKGQRESAIPDLAAAFARVGMNPPEQPEEGTVEKVLERREPLRNWLLVGLVRWAGSLQKTEPEKADRLKRVIATCDADPWRQSLLEAIEKRDSETIERLAVSPKLREEPITTVLWLSWACVDPDVAEQTEHLLRRAQRAAPANFWTNYYLGMNLVMADADIQMEGEERRGMIESTIDAGMAPGMAPVAKVLSSEMADAIGFLRAAGAARSDAGKAWMTLGVILSSVGYGNDAIAAYEQSVELNPNDSSTLFFLTSALVGEKRFEEALEVGKSAVVLDPAEDRFHYMIIHVLAQLGRDEDALAICENATERGIDPGMAYTTLGQTQWTRRDFDKALASFHLAIKANPDLAEARLGLGVVLAMRKEFAAAITSLDEAIKRKPDLANAHNARGIAFMSQGTRSGMAEAIVSYGKAIDANPAYAQAYSNLGIAHLQLGEHEAAVVALNEAVALSPGFAMAWSNLGLAYDQLDRSEEAIEAFKKAIAADSRLGMARDNLSNTLRKLGRFEEAIEVSKGSNDPAAHVELGMALSRADRLKEAIAEFQHALDLKPDSREALSNLALTYLRAGRGEEALPLLENALPQLNKILGEAGAERPATVSDLVPLFHQAGREKEALALQETLVAVGKMHNEDGAETLEAMQTLAALHREAGRLDKAFALYEEVLAVRKRTPGAEDPVTLETMNELAIEYGEAGRLNRAVELQQEALKLMRRAPPEDLRLLLEALEYMAILCDRTDQAKRALTLREEALKLSGKVRGPEDEQTLGNMTNLAISYSRANRLDDAIALEEEALKLKRHVLPKDHPYLGKAMGLLADLYVRKGRTDEALDLHEELLVLRRREFGPADADTTGAMNDLLEANSNAGRIQEPARTLAAHLEHLRRAGEDPEAEPQLSFRQQLSDLAGEQSKRLVTPEAVERHYEENRDSFRETSVHLHMITIVREEEKEARAAQRKEVEALCEEIEDGASFAAAARAHSMDPYAEDGGDRGEVKRGNTPFDEHLENAIFAAEPGKPAIHESEKFLWILVVEDPLEGEVVPLEEVRDEIAKILGKSRGEKLLEEWREEARKAVAGGAR